MTTVSDDELIARLEEDASYIDNYEGFVGSPDRIVRTLAEAAARLRSLSESKRELVELLAKIDGSWAADFPEGPDGKQEWGALMTNETVEIWRSIRAVIAKEAGHAE